MFGWHFFLVRAHDGSINAFHNICRHRGHPIVSKTCGTTSFFACKFHGWSYKTDGTLYKAREYDDLADFDRSDHSLFRIHTHVTAQGFIFVNFDAREKPSVSFEDQFGDDFDPTPKAATGRVVGDEFALFQKDEYEYDHTWNSSIGGTKYNWKTFVDGFQECYHCLTGHPTTLPKDFCLKDYYLRQGHGASRHFLPPSRDDLSEAYITWLYPLGVITFSENLLFIGRFNAKGALDTSYDSETYRRTTRISKPSEEYDKWMNHEIAYWRLVETEDVELAVDAQKGFLNGVLARGRLHPTQGACLSRSPRSLTNYCIEHAVKWYQTKVKQIVTDHAKLEAEEGRNIDYSIPQAQSDYGQNDDLCKLIGPEYEW